jgi:aryl-alcohol dehydrogenase-like predicted oxidoreductase
MQDRNLGWTDLKVSRVGLGTWAMGDDFWGSVDDQESIRTIHAAIDNGISLVDTAPAYGNGHSEEVVGKAIKGRRDRVVVATKVGIQKSGGKLQKNLSPDSVRQEIEDSLRRLGVESIDLYQIHWPDPKTPLEETLEVLLKAQEAGKFRYLGVSNFDTALMDKVRSITELASLQPPFSLMQRDIEDEILPYCHEHNIGVLSYGTLSGGILTGKFREYPTFEEGDQRAKFYPAFNPKTWDKVQNVVDALREIASERNVPVAQVAINWATAQPGMTCALVGAKKPEQAISNAAAGQWELSNAELERIQEAHAANFPTV